MSSTGEGPVGDAAPAAQAATEDPRAAAEAHEQARVRAEAAAYQQESRRVRAKARTLTNMVWALLACFGVVAFLMIVTWRPHDEQVKAVEYTAQLQDAQKAAPWVRGPEPMPTGWAATSVEFLAPQQEPMTWHLGIVTNDKKYVGLEQSNVTGPKFQYDKLGNTSDDGTTTVDGVTWQKKILLDRKAENALVIVGSGVTTIVTGNAGYPALEQFAATLR